MNNALVTGGAGFIGSHLAETLLHSGYAVQIIDDLSTGSVENISHLKHHSRFSYVFDTVMNRPVQLELIRQADVVFHLAAAVGVNLIVDDPVKTIETNIKTTELVLEYCARESKPVLLTSTSEVYGKSAQPKFNEGDDMVLGPTSNSRWCYAASKIIDEFLAQAYFKDKGLPVVVVRLFNTIGPRQTGRYGMVVPRLVKQALSGEPITVYGDGQQTRSFGWVGDVADAMIRLIGHPQAYGQVFNVGHSDEIPILQLAQMIKEKTQSSSPIEFVPYDHAYGTGFEDIPRRLPDLKKIQQLIGYQPSLDLPAMLDRIIAFSRQHMEVPVT